VQSSPPSISIDGGEIESKNKPGRAPKKIIQRGIKAAMSGGCWFNSGRQNDAWA
jgi:hypothetical protein